MLQCINKSKSAIAYVVVGKQQMSKVEIFGKREYSNKYSKNKYSNKYSINIQKIY